MTNENEDKSRDVAVRVEHTPTKISFGPANEIDLTGIPDKERAQLLADYNKGVLDISVKAHDMKVDVDALHATLNSLSNTTNQAVKDGSSITITHTQDTSIGRTEIIMGNTDQAQTGRLARSQTGEKDWTPYYIFGGILALIIIVALFAGR
ncbi:hypothetical protein [Falsihalocynthiibacter sp. CO-5D18]|uniref:hypothetical protein n=1 Tax=Falsihalocynthiibacter sp. CO-5D18 TaxID=3240872 RepID=UPI00350F3B78